MGKDLASLFGPHLGHVLGHRGELMELPLSTCQGWHLGHLGGPLSSGGQHGNRPSGLAQSPAPYRFQVEFEPISQLALFTKLWIALYFPRPDSFPGHYSSKLLLQNVLAH